MKRSITVVSMACAVAVLMALPAQAQRGFGGGNGNGQGQGGLGSGNPAQGNGGCGGALEAAFDAMTAVPLSSAEVAAVIDLREEEKLARDVYLTLGERWQLPVFVNIARAEQSHMDHTLMLFSQYGLEDPVADDTVGTFTSDEYTQLFLDLTSQGEASLVEALRVGATIEDLDISDINSLLGLSANEHIRLVAQNLNKGSRNHLRAFVGALAAQGETYSAQFLGQEEIDNILDASWEKGVVYGPDGEVIAECGRGRDRNKGRRGSRMGNGAGDGSCGRRGNVSP